MNGLLRWTLVLAAGAGLLFAAAFAGLEVPAAAAWPAAGGPLAFAAAVGLLIADVLLPVPSSLVAAGAVWYLGPPAGGCAVWLGLTGGCLLADALGRAGRRLGDLNAPPALRAALARHGPWLLVVLRAVPVAAESSVFAAGLLGLSWRRTMLATGLANLGLAAAYAAFGRAAGGALGLGAAVAVPLAGWAGWRLWQGRRAVSAGAVIDVDFTQRYRYPVHFLRGVFDPAQPRLAATLGRGARALFVFDQGLLAARPQLWVQAQAYCRRWGVDCGAAPFLLPGGEAAKTVEQVAALHAELLARGLDRQAYLVAAGGGAVLDAAGFAAATFHRGLRLVRLPSTVLAQNDAGIGVKNGINAHGEKNLVGCFAPPWAVINDLDWLDSLPQRAYRAGFAEAVKVALIRDGAFFAWLEQAAPALVRRDPAATETLVRRCAALHLRQIARGGDPFETGNARPLDYGHWAAHRLESLSGYRLLHGEAVALGMALDACYAARAGLLAAADLERLLALLAALGFALWHPLLAPADPDPLEAGLEAFRQHLGGRLCITLLTGIGRAVEVDRIDRALLHAARCALAEHADRLGACT
ncbi:MAG: hypothetical protein KatS3mg121_1203 [Gammaproteobacteria bacterium]|nr:MAG: hypothetical protein KatS3mg121_1203 [Gammaproteobacteria bacterium]